MTFLYMVMALLPSFLQRPIRNLMGAHIARGASIAPFTMVRVRDLRMEKGARIDPLVVIQAETAILGRNARIRPLSKFKVRHLQMGRDALIDPLVLVNCDYGPRSRLELGRFVRVFSFSVLEPSEGIFVGDHTGLGGHCLIFCHGSWPNYLEGAPYARGPVRLGEEVWIPWRVMILPNVEIGSGAIIGAHSLVRSDVPARSLFSGVPARLIAENVWTPTDDVQEKERRLDEVIESFHAFHEGQWRDRLLVHHIQSDEWSSPAAEVVAWSFSKLGREEVVEALERRAGVTVVDLAELRAVIGGEAGRLFVAHLATFGVRLSQMDVEEI